MPLTYDDITGLNGLEDNIGGISTRVFWAPKSWFATIGAVADFATATTASELVEISTDHTFTTGKGFLEIYSTRDKGKDEIATVGERDGKGSLNKGKIFNPGVNVAKLGQYRMMKNDSGIWLFELSDGVLIQLGSNRFPAEQSVKFDTAQNESGVRGTEIEVTAFESFIQVYTGAVTMKP